MNKEDKDLLLRDLSARLPYGVKVTWDGKHPLTVTPHIYCAIISEDNIDNFPKLLLRPMSSMTEEEKEEFESLGWRVDELDDNAPWNHNSYNVFDGVDWLNKKMFAYRTIDGKDMFELGLAFKAPEGMYN